MTTDYINHGSLAAPKFIKRVNRFQEISIRLLSSGKYRYRMINTEEIRAGDRIVLKVADGLKPTIKGPVGICKAKEELYVLYVYRDGQIRLSVRGKPRSKVVIPVLLPSIRSKPRRILGPLMASAIVPDRIKLPPYDSYFTALDELVIGTGCNYMSICPIGRWTVFDQGSPFENQGDKEDLTTISETFCRMMITLLWRAAREGVVVHIYPFEFVSFNHKEHWARNPLNSRNNVNGWINPEPNEFVHINPKLRGLRNYHKFHLAVRDRIPQFAPELLESYFRCLAECIPFGHHHALVPVLEGQSRTVDLELSRVCLGRPIGTNLKAMYDDSYWSAAAEPLNQVIKSDPRWQELLSRCSFVALHHCDSGGDTRRRISRLMPFARQFDLDVLGSTDGTGTGTKSDQRRPEGSRPNKIDITSLHKEGLEAAGDRYLGTEVKLIEKWDAARAFLRSLAEKIDLGR